MTKFKKRILVASLILGLVVSSQSKAVIPVVVAVGAFLGSDAVALTGTAFLGVGLAALVGVKVGMLEIPTTDGSGVMRVPLTDLPRDRPVANPTLSGIIASTYVPPVAAGYTSNAVQACQSAIGAMVAPSFAPTRTYTFISASNYCPSLYGDCIFKISDSAINQSIGVAATCTYSGGTAASSTCPTGYSLSAGTCVLTAPRDIPDQKADYEVVQSAGRLAFQQMNEAVSGDHYDDIIHEAAVDFMLMHPDYVVDGLPASYYQDNPDVAKIAVSIDPNGGTSGTCPYQTCIPLPGSPGHFRISAISNGASGAKATVIDINRATGVIDQATSVPLAGQVIQAGTQYKDAAGVIQTVQTGQIVLANATAGTYTQAAQNTAPSPAINIPTDYARAGEAAIGAKTITDKLAETEPSTDLSEPVLTNPLSDYFNPLRAWSMPSVGGTCPFGGFDWNNTHYSFDAGCTLFNDNLTIIRGAMNVVYSLAALFIVLGA